MTLFRCQTAEIDVEALNNQLKFECAHMAPNSKPVVKVERCRQNLNRSLHDLLWFMNYYLATHSMYLDILTASYITEEYVRTRRKYKCTLCGRRLKDCPPVLLKEIPRCTKYHLVLNVTLLQCPIKMRVFHQNESCPACPHPPLSYEGGREKVCSSHFDEKLSF